MTENRAGTVESLSCRAVSTSCWQTISNSESLWCTYSVVLKSNNNNKLTYYCMVGDFRGSKFSCFGELRRFRRFIFLWHTYSNHLLKFSNFCG